MSDAQSPVSIVVAEGDGIGPEITRATLRMLEAAGAHDRKRRRERAVDVRPVLADEAKRQYEDAVKALTGAPQGRQATVGGYGIVVSFPATALPGLTVV